MVWCLQISQHPKQTNKQKTKHTTKSEIPLVSSILAKGESIMNHGVGSVTGFFWKKMEPSFFSVLSLQMLCYACVS